MPLNHKKERCRAKAKAKGKAKAIRTSFFFGLDVFFWCGLSFSIQFWPFSFLSPDPDLGPDQSPGSAMRGSGLYVNLRRQKL
jgi:hypothetical protein